ncbi:MAG: hypothetical protein HWD83_06055 [Gammaproteobacteria bacterium]|nr:hypothetical protein [Gammaproteobacteria bacterium]
MQNLNFKKILRALAITAALVPLSSGSFAAMQDDSAANSESEETVVHTFDLEIKEERADERVFEIEERMDRVRARIEAIEEMGGDREALQARTEINLIIRELESELGSELGNLNAGELAQHIISKQGEFEVQFSDPVEPNVMLVGVIDEGYLNEWLEAKQSFSDRESRFEMLMPMLSVIVIFGTPVLIVGLVSYFRTQRRKAAVQAVSEIVARNPNMDPDTIDEIRAALAGDAKRASSKANVGRKDLRKGAILTAIGAAVSLGFMFDGNWEDLWFGLIILFAGAAFLWLHHASPSQPEEL